MTQRMSLGIPFCRRHVRHWSKRWAVGLSLFAVFAILMIASLVFDANQPPGQANAAPNALRIAAIGSGAVCVLFAAFAEQSAIRTLSIKKGAIKLKNVHEDFKSALLVDRKRDRQANENDYREQQRSRQEGPSPDPKKPPRLPTWLVDDSDRQSKE
jgi:hypothetical protein